LNNIIETDVQTKATVLALPTSRAPPSCNNHGKKVWLPASQKIKVLGMRKHMKWDETFGLHHSALEVNPP
jgi:hypothetical protein